MVFVVYMLECRDGTLYTGSTNDLEKRIHQHNHLKSGARYTKQRRPVRLVYTKICKTLKEARQKEYRIKCLERKEKLQLVSRYHPSMNIRTAKFIKGVVEEDEILEDPKKSQIAFIGRSNVGKSSLINSLTKQKGLARTSSFPGRTQEINVFLINKSYYFVDLPGYGFARMSIEARDQLHQLVGWYLFESDYIQKKVVLIIDANIGPTKDDLEMLQTLDENHKNIVVVANKIDKIRKSSTLSQLQKIQKIIGAHKIIPYSSEKNIGVSELTKEILE